MNAQAYRLPTHVWPRRYDIALSASVGSATFAGTVAIALDIRERRPTIDIHARALDLQSATLETAATTVVGAVTLDAEREVAVIDFGQPLPLGAATLRIAYAGEVNRGLDGLYLATDGPEQMLCTQFQATAARAAFPCFDEPVFKAQFAWTITTAADATVLANGPLLDVTPSADGTARTWRFAPTKPMSTYLGAIVIGDIAGTPEQTVAGTPLRVWAMRGKEGMAGFAQQYTGKLLPWYERYFAAPYHYDKYDQVAVPGFSSGAMENSGLVLFRQGYLLADGQTTSWSQEKTIAHIIAHEFAHMWFGNLVTMSWWDDLWLNEAFAEWVSTKAVSELSPSYAIWDDFQSTKGHALAIDALETTHPIYTPVQTPAEADQLFDTITYSKGCAVLRMVEQFLGEDVFRAGVRTYMREFGERNAVGADLWRHLHEASDAPVAELMPNWITQSGHPLIDVALAGPNRLQLRQQRFFSSPAVAAGNDQLWDVPLLIRYADDAGTHETRFLLREREATVTLELQGALRWCYANAGEIGFYRQRLSPELRQLLLAELGALSSGEQVGLLRDQWALVRQGSQPIGEFLPVLEAIAAIPNYHVAGAAVGYLHTLKGLVEATGDQSALAGFRAWVAQLFGDRLAELGLAPAADESTNTAQQRIALLTAMTMLAEDEEVLEQATAWADREGEDAAAVDANLAGVYINVAALWGDERRFERHVALYQARRAAAATPQETTRYLQSFPLFRTPELVARTLELLDTAVIPQESVGTTLLAMLHQEHAQRAAWSYATANWQAIRKLGLNWVGYLVEAAGYLPIALRDEVTAFFDRELKGEAQLAYGRALETMDQQAELRARTRADLVRRFGA